MNDLHDRKPWVKISKQGYLTQIRAEQPKEGVWYRGETGEDQVSYEFGAKDGRIMVGMACYHGQSRMAAFNAIKNLHSR